jgi:hypothetical protein
MRKGDSSVERGLCDEEFCCLRKLRVAAITAL